MRQVRAGPQRLGGAAPMTAGIAPIAGFWSMGAQGASAALGTIRGGV